MAQEYTKLKDLSISLRKERNDNAPSITAVLAMATQIAKDDSSDKQNFIITDDHAIQAIRKTLKQDAETIAILEFNNGTGNDLHVKLTAVTSMLNELLPQAPTRENLSDFVLGVIANQNLDKTPKSMGPIMKALSDQYGASLDRGIASTVVKELLAS